MKSSTALNKIVKVCKRRSSVDAEIILQEIRSILITYHQELPRCPAIIHHGPGHQSKTHCHLKLPHEIHECRYGRYDQLARWKGKEVSSGFFDEPPADPEE